MTGDGTVHSDPSEPDPFEQASEAARVVAARTGTDRHDVAVVLGSGWRAAADRLGAPDAVVAAADLPGFMPQTVPGHPAEVWSVRIGGVRVLVLLGRVHLYEGHGPAAVAHGVRTAVLGGCRTVILTNAAGAVSPRLAVGEPVLIADHIDLTGASVLAGPNPDELGPRFPDMSEVYATRLRDLARTIDPSLVEGVYVGMRGPQYETPAEIGMIAAVGGDLVGMSTVHEAVAARHLGAEVLALSLVTNPAAGASDVELDHLEVLAAADAAAGRVGSLLAEVIVALGAEP